MRGLIVAICIVLAGCAADPPPAPVAAAPPPAPPPPKPPPPKMVWVRTDGQYPPGWQQQGDVDYASCEAAAINASNQVVIPLDAYPAVVARQQRRKTFDVNLEACLAQHGYKLVPEKIGR